MYDEYEFINRYQKEDVYTLYYQMVDDAKDYEKITKKKMLVAIYEALIEDPSLFDGYVSGDALNVLIQFAHHKTRFKHDSLEEYELILELQDFYLISYYGGTEGYRIPSMIQEVVHSIVITKRHKELDTIYDFLKGVLLIRGHVSMDELVSIYDSCKPAHLSITLDEALMSLPRIFLKINMLVYQYEDSFEHYAFYRESVYSDYDPVYQHTWETYLSVGKYGINIYNPILNQFYEKLKQQKSEFMINQFLEDFVIRTQISLDFDMSYMMQNFVDIENDIDQAVKLYNEVVREIPRWKFKGDPVSLVDMSKIKEVEPIPEDDELYDLIDCPCGSGLLIDTCCLNQETLLKHHAVLSDDRAHLFYGLYYVLIHRTNQKYRLHPHFSNIEKFVDRLLQPDFVKIADKFFESPEIINDYINQYKSQITPPQLEILTGFQYAFKKHFIALRYEDQKLLLLDEEKKIIYAVSGIVSGIALNIPYDVLPQFVETRLIPLNHEIIYDVFINQSPVVIGTNIRKELKKIEKKTRIIRNIEELFEMNSKVL